MNVRKSCVLFFRIISKKWNARSSCVLFSGKINKKRNARSSCVLFFEKISKKWNVRSSCVLFSGKINKKRNVRWNESIPTKEMIMLTLCLLMLHRSLWLEKRAWQKGSASLYYYVHSWTLYYFSSSLTGSQTLMKS